MDALKAASGFVLLVVVGILTIILGWYGSVERWVRGID